MRLKQSALTIEPTGCPLGATPGPLAENVILEPFYLLLFTGLRRAAGRQSGESRPCDRSSRMHAPIKYIEKGLVAAANGVWVVFNGLNKLQQNPSFIPACADKPLLKPHEKTKP